MPTLLDTLNPSELRKANEYWQAARNAGFIPEELNNLYTKSGVWAALNAPVQETRPGFSVVVPPTQAQAQKHIMDRALSFLGVGMTLYHGSPHMFDKFSLSKIGTGEGAQAYGHGLYFAESPGVAKSYQNMTSKPFIDSDFQGGWAIYRPDPTVRGMAGPQRKISESFKTRAEAEQALAKTPDTSALYEVDIPDSAIGKMLDYDKPLNQQSPEVKKVLEDSGLLKELRDFYGRGDDPLRMIGADFYRGLAEIDKEASDILKRAGIPGIKYLDQASRGAGEGTRNLVVFDDSIIKILKRNGQEVK